jgi:hypothetical protein
MSTQTIYRVLLNLPPINAQGGQLILEESTTDPGYQKGNSFKVTKRVGITTQAGLLNEKFPYQTGLENQEFSFMVSEIDDSRSHCSNKNQISVVSISRDQNTVLFLCCSKYFFITCLRKTNLSNKNYIVFGIN